MYQAIYRGYNPGAHLVEPVKEKEKPTSPNETQEDNIMPGQSIPPLTYPTPPQETRAL